MQTQVQVNRLWAARFAAARANTPASVQAFLAAKRAYDEAAAASRAASVARVAARRAAS